MIATRVSVVVMAAKYRTGGAIAVVGYPEVRMTAPQRIGWRWATAVAVLFALSRLGWWLAGVRFDASPLAWYWQILDLDLLRERLVESLWYLHAQPPGFNALLGLAAVAGDPAVVLRWAFLALGAALAVALADGLRRLGWSAPWASGAALVLANGLPWVMTEHWLFYDFPSMVLLGVAGWALLRLGDHPRVAVPVFVGACVGLSLGRSLFHPLWLVASLTMMVWAAPPAVRRRAGIVAAAGLLVVAAVLVKNGALFGLWGTSSWLGMSLAKMTTARLPSAERDAMIRDGRLSPLAGVRPFSPVEVYEHAARARWQGQGIPVLARRTRASGAPNYNHVAYLEIDRVGRSDAATVIRRRPAVYAEAVAGAARTFLQSPIRYPALTENLRRVPRARWLYERTLGLLPVTVMLFLAAGVAATSVARREVRSDDPGLTAAGGFLVLNLLWVAGVASCLEIGENNRFQTLVSPMVWVALLAAGRWALSRSRWRGSGRAR
jgi:hypothetical protein